MLNSEWHVRIIAYRLEDKHGNSPPYCYNGHRALLPCGYNYAYLNPSRFKEACYRNFCMKYSLYEYVLLPSALAYDTGEVLFRDNQIVTKTKLGR